MHVWTGTSQVDTRHGQERIFFALVGVKGDWPYLRKVPPEMGFIVEYVHGMSAFPFTVVVEPGYEFIIMWLQLHSQVSLVQWQ